MHTSSNPPTRDAKENMLFTYTDIEKLNSVQITGTDMDSTDICCAAGSKAKRECERLQYGSEVWFVVNTLPVTCCIRFSQVIKQIQTLTCELRSGCGFSDVFKLSAHAN